MNVDSYSPFSNLTLPMPPQNIPRAARRHPDSSQQNQDGLHQGNYGVLLGRLSIREAFNAARSTHQYGDIAMSSFQPGPDALRVALHAGLSGGVGAGQCAGGVQVEEARMA